MTLEGLFSQFGDPRAPESLTAVSDSDGSYTIANVPYGNRRLQVSAEGYANKTQGGLVFYGTEQLETDVVLHPAEMISGRVSTKSGAPVSDAKVMAMSFSNSNRQCRDETLTDENGEFRLERLASGKYTIAVSAKGHRRAHEPRVMTGTTELLIELEEADMVSGRVFTADGELPTPYEVQVRQTHPGNSVTTRIGERIEFEDRNGSFSMICTQSGTFVIEAEAPGYAPTFSEEFRFTLGRELTDISVHLTRGGGLTGRVLDDAGRPLAGARITTRDPTWSNSLFDRALGNQFPTNITSAKTATSENGSFELQLLKAESYQLRLLAPGFCEHILTPLNVIEGRTLDIGDISLIQGGEIRGTVIDDDGSPTEGALVRLDLDEAERAHPRQYETMSGPNGEYKLSNIYPGQYKLVAKMPRQLEPFCDLVFENLKHLSVVRITDGQALRFVTRLNQ